MSIADHREYFERRLSESAALAEKAGDPALAHVYRQFASHYARALAEEQQGKLRVISTGRRGLAK
ncbi:hypothetical protein HRJ34_08045 [Rhizorhabdus wittichii]|uniref:Uncharacterized protein n=1 Tax=Rhizorhabdus wittichii TaxID=160791 RepID=A0A975D5H8_9SPHN|nr:hypothetical protein [Rhizorhabdus wittichii]QTH23437.1 hypothetical protein HRJ34_08045 [Rhizorhabdus wittichii]